MRGRCGLIVRLISLFIFGYKSVVYIRYAASIIIDWQN